MAEYGDGRSTSSRDAVSAFAMRFIANNFSSFAALTILRHIYFYHKRTTMTSETSENTIFVCCLLHPMLSDAYPPYNKQLLDEVEHDIMNYQSRGLCYR